MFICLRVSAVFSPVSHVQNTYGHAIPTHQLFLLAYGHVTRLWFSPARDRVNAKEKNFIVL